MDMGGTSLDVCLIKDGRPWMRLDSAVGGLYHMRLPLIDIHTIGAGGGSIDGWISLALCTWDQPAPGQIPDQHVMIKEGKCLRARTLILCWIPEPGILSGGRD